MTKVYFTNNWGENDVILCKRLLTTTINCSGKWNNIEYTTNIDDTDYVVSLGGLNKKLKFPIDKIIVLQREPDILLKMNIKNKLSFPYTKLHHAWTHPEHMQLNYDEFLNLVYKKDEKIKKFSTITSMRLHTPYCHKRVNFITDFCKKYPNTLDVYGAKWDNRLNDNYKGELPFHNLNGENNRISDNTNISSKYDGLKNYKYSLCIENSCYDNYFTEKITDCLLSWTIPIYFGCPNINKYFPKDSYYWIDINDPNSIDKLYEIIQTPITEKNIEAMIEARRLIMDEYNIWNLIDNIILNDK